MSILSKRREPSPRGATDSTSTRTSYNLALRSASGLIVASIVLFAIAVFILLFVREPDWLPLVAAVAGLGLFLTFLLRTDRRIRAGLRKAKMFLQSDRESEGLGILQRLEFVFEKNYKLKYALAITYVELERWGDASRHWKSLFDKFGTPTFAIDLARAYRFGGRRRDAVNILHGLAENYSESELFPVIITEMGKCFTDAGDYVSAIEIYERGPLKEQKLTEDLMKLHYCLADAYEKAGRKKDALRHYKLVYSADSGYSDVQQKIQSLSMELTE